MKQPNGCSTPAPKSSAAKQWIKEELAQTKEDDYKVMKAEPYWLIPGKLAANLELLLLLFLVFA